MSAAEPPVASSSKTPAEAPPRGPGPDAASFKRHPERAYTGPKEASLPKRLIEFKNPDHNPRIEPPLPRLARASGWAGWIVGTGMAIYMVLYADFGPQEHVFSPVRREWHKISANIFNLSPAERAALGLDKDGAAAGATSGDAGQKPPRQQGLVEAALTAPKST